MAEPATATTTPFLSSQGLSAAAETYGATFYLADLSRFEENCYRLLRAFREIYPNTSVGYSYKTNYLPELVLCADALGAYSEVVSQFEVDIATGLGIPANRIIFNGPIKRRRDILAAINGGARVNVDSFAELRAILAMSDELPQRSQIGIRCWLGPDTPGSRFGIDLESAEGKAALAAVDAAANLGVSGLHCHFSGDRSADQYRRMIRSLIRLHKTALGNRRLQYIDIGGGFASNMPPSLAAQLPAPPNTFADYAAVLATEMRSAYGEHGPELILEPGMALVADVMMLVTRVETVKHLGPRRLAVVDGSIFNIKPLRGAMNLPALLIPSDHTDSDRPAEGCEGPWDIVGHTCMEIDVLHEGYDERIRPGDYVVLSNVGAYTNVLNAPFIRGTPPIVEYRDDGIGRLLRPASTPADLLRSYGYGGAA